MNFRCFIFLILAAGTILSCHRGKLESDRIQPFDDTWLFHRGDVPGAEEPGFADSSWRQLDLPHDWSIEDIPGTNSPFDSTVVNGVASGFTRGGTGWYRKHFRMDDNYTGSCVFIRFDGVYMNSDVWVNGHHAGNHYYGYTPFEYEISQWLDFGGDNVVAVRVVNDSVRCRWYSGSGIYRHVQLVVTPRLHIASRGIAIVTPEINANSATVEVTTTVINQSEISERAILVVNILDSKKKVVAKCENPFDLQAGLTATLKNKLIVESPRLWSPENPEMYSVVCELKANGSLIDSDSQCFGIRSVKFDAQQGFLLNGVVMKLKGGCIHHDNGPLGAAAFDRAEERKIELLKAAGYNAVRMAHNPPSEVMLNACDRLGILVIDEAFDMWRYGHFSGDYSARFDSLWQSDLESMVLHDRNHPSVIMWSIGNEIRYAGSPEIDSVCGILADFVRALDPTRPVTAAQNAVSEQKDNYFSQLDVCGYNYALGSYKTDHTRKPDRVIFGSESYASEAYDYWQSVSKNPWVTGDFVWTAFDYIGEASIGWRGYPQDKNFFPWNLAYCGDIDICGNRRPQSFYRQTLWGEKPVVNLFVKPPEPSFPLNPLKEKWSKWDWPDVVESWNFEGLENRALLVTAYTNCDAVELFLNGKSMGKEVNLPDNKNIVSWNVPYNSGELIAYGFRNGKIADTSILRTAGKPAMIVMKPDRATISTDGQDLSYITVEITDSPGYRNPLADNRLTFSVSGPGSIIAAGNANPMSKESFRQPERKAWRGQCLVIVRSSKQKGNIRLTASSDGLKPAEIIIKAE
ncbi:MAG TPA: glycoside hydrolase family 2 TIM barrel-domain containing protein [Bacteroidales bacterium]|jgi:beta-galactosidase|nr:glycoside hydrolase family 2 TIM barrel-domain containing protein [Bacteroidales bacterium]